MKKIRKNIIDFLENHNRNFILELKNIDMAIKRGKDAGDTFIDIIVKESHKTSNKIYTELRLHTCLVDTSEEIVIFEERLIGYYTSQGYKVTYHTTHYGRRTIRIEYSDKIQKEDIDLLDKVSTLMTENLEKDKQNIPKKINDINEKIINSVKNGDTKFIINIFVPVDGMAYGTSIGCHNFYMYFVKNETSIDTVKKELSKYYRGKGFMVDDNEKEYITIYYNADKDKKEKQNKENKEMGKLLDDVVKISKGETTVESVNYTAKIDEFIKSVAKDFKSIEVMVLIEGESVSASDIEENTICIVAAKDQRAELCGDLWTYYEKEEFDVEFDGCGILNISWEEHIKEDKDNE